MHTNGRAHTSREKERSPNWLSVVNKVHEESRPDEQYQWPMGWTVA